MNNFHTPVLGREVVKFLDIQKNHRYIDATIGGGGHSLEIIKKGGIVLGIDQDKEAIDYLIQSFSDQYKNKLVLVKGNFNNIRKIARTCQFNQVSGILFDLGVSSYQLNNPNRGFSFKSGGPLDMRMDNSEKRTAFELINTGSEEILSEIFTKFGEEPLTKNIVREIMKIRKVDTIKTTTQLAGIIEGVYRQKKQKIRIHPATKIFQAIRIWVNQELDNLRIGINEAVELLEPRGRLLIISYHSLEDRIVKLKMIELKEKGQVEIITKKPIYPGWQEIKLNHRARSAKLRIAQKL